MISSKFCATGEGALAGYGPSLASIYKHQIARQLVKLLRGAKPADIPAEQPTELKLGINQRTPEKLGLGIPEAFLGRADQVIRSKVERLKNSNMRWQRGCG